ncbi:MAG: hypothetical protein PVH77_10380 [Phycisphaerales bacterium]|jgi:hypothetical protein
MWGEGNIDVDPLFTVHGYWVDAGDPNSPVGDEPLPNGGVINMGAYGGTREASKSP